MFYVMLYIILLSFHGCSSQTRSSFWWTFSQWYSFL